jgi:biopolymer transport protein ExbD
MSKFKKKANTKQEIPTSSMPDVVFMLLFFFMVTTEMRKTTINVQQRIPEATQLKKLQRKTVIKDLYIGEPKKKDEGTDAKIQADDVFISVKDIITWANRSIAELPPIDQPAFTVNFKVDSEAKRGIIADVETELRKANARIILYSTMAKREEK